jgi:hypothetical protein
MDVISKTFKQLYGKPCWSVKYDPQLNLSLSFGEPVLRIREPYKTKSKSKRIRRLAASRHISIKGAWWLWIYGSYWRLSQDGKTIARSSSTTRKIKMGMESHGGQKLTHVNLDPRNGKTRFEFDLGGVLEARRFDRASDIELWLLYKPNGYVLSIRGEGQYNHTLGSSHDENWKPIGGNHG